MSGDLAETRCDLCDANDWEVLAEDCPDNCRVVLCRRCSLMQAFPRLAPAELDTFYDEVFSFDYGAPAKAAGDLLDPGRLVSEEELADIVSRNSLIGTAKVYAPAAEGERT